LAAILRAAPHFQSFPREILSCFLYRGRRPSFENPNTRGDRGRLPRKATQNDLLYEGKAFERRGGWNVAANAIGVDVVLGLK
jgi:hypothetical protein